MTSSIRFFSNQCTRSWGLAQVYYYYMVSNYLHAQRCMKWCHECHQDTCMLSGLWIDVMNTTKIPACWARYEMMSWIVSRYLHAEQYMKWCNDYHQDTCMLRCVWIDVMNITKIPACSAEYEVVPWMSPLYLHAERTKKWCHECHQDTCMLSGVRIDVMNITKTPACWAIYELMNTTKIPACSAKYEVVPRMSPRYLHAEPLTRWYPNCIKMSLPICDIKKLFSPPPAAFWRWRGLR